MRAHPGLTPYVLRRQAATPAMLDKIEAHHRRIARIYGLRSAQARWLLSTVAFHCIAVSDTVYSLACAPTQPDDEPEDLANAAARAAQRAEMEAELEQGMQALIVGALALLEQRGVMGGAPPYRTWVRRGPAQDPRRTRSRDIKPGDRLIAPGPRQSCGWTPASARCPAAVPRTAACPLRSARAPW